MSIFSGGGFLYQAQKGHILFSWPILILASKQIFDHSTYFTGLGCRIRLEQYNSTRANSYKTGCTTRTTCGIEVTRITRPGKSTSPRQVISRAWRSHGPDKKNRWKTKLSDMAFPRLWIDIAMAKWCSVDGTGLGQKGEMEKRVTYVAGLTSRKSHWPG